MQKPELRGLYAFFDFFMKFALLALYEKRLRNMFGSFL